MASVFSLKALGLNIQPNQLDVDDGSLTVAKNVIINRDNVVESRRGFKIYGNAFGSSSDRAKQLIAYKQRIIRYFSGTLQFDDGTGRFRSFGDAIDTADPQLRMKSIEFNGNLYLTSSDGIKKISAKTADDLTTTPGLITSAGAVKALDIQAATKYNYGDQISFLTEDSAVAYRVVWGYKDANNNLFLGTPSQRVEVYNSLQSLLLKDYMKLLQSIDNVGYGGSLIDDKDYVNTLKIEASSTGADLRAKLLALTTKLDENLLYADNDGAPTGAPLEINTATITLGVCTINFASGDPSLYVSSGQKIFLDGFSPATGVLNGAQTVSTVTATDLSFNTTASGAVTVTGSATIKSNEYRSITLPTEVDLPATHNQLVELQDYISAIITRLNLEPNAVISTTLLNEYIQTLDITKASTVTLKITVPDTINSSYFFQIYRSAVFTAEDVSVLELDVAPNDELQLVYEAFPTSSEVSAGEIVVEDIVPDAFRGANLYTNAATGEGILQSNDLPPFARDINVFRGSVFFANTRTRHRKDQTLIGVQSMIADYIAGTTPTLTIASSNGTQTYKFVVGVSEVVDLTTVPASSLVSVGASSYFLINSGNNVNKYYVWYKQGTSTDPSISGRTGVQVLLDPTDTDAIVAQKTRDALNVLVSDFSASVSTNVVTVTALEVGYTDDALAGTSGFTVNVTSQGSGEDVTQNQVLLSNDLSPARAVEETATSLARVINRNSLEQVDAFYLSGAQEVPGKMLFESRLINNSQFFMTTNNENTGASFNPTLAPDFQISSISTGSPTTMLVTTSSAHGLNNLDYVMISGSDSTPSIDGYHQITYVSSTSFRIPVTVTVAGTEGGVIAAVNSEFSSNEEAKNRVYYSKFQQPESVPVLNYLDIGARDKAVLRIFPLRDSLFVFKEDGLYRISGESIPFNVSLFDSSYTLLAPDSLAELKNVIYGWTTEGISSVSESGARLMSRPIDTLIVALGSSTSYPNFSPATWGMSYDSENSYYIYTVSASSDEVATRAFVYNIVTNTWTTSSKSFTCGVVNPADNSLYMGAGDINFIEKERKDFARSDYADREYTFDIQENRYLGNTTIILDSVNNIDVNDVLVQTQTLTVYTFNSLLKKLDLDSGIPSNDYFSTLEASAGDDLRDKLIALAQKLDADGLTLTNYESSIDTKSGAISLITAGSSPVVTSIGHGLLTGRKVILAGTNCSPNINGTFIVDVLDANTFTVQPLDTVINPGTTGTFTTIDSDFDDLKVCYNQIIEKLNLDGTVSFSNYMPLNTSTTQEVLITGVNRVAKRITIAFPLDLIVGSFTVFKSIDCEIQYSPNTFGGDPVSLKHMREAQLLFETLAFTRGIISFATDLLPKFEQVEFEADGNGRFGFSNFGEGFFGGGSNSAPIRTYIPRNCQRCRFMVVKFNHRVAREKWSLFGISITGETDLSSRSYK